MARKKSIPTPVIYFSKVETQYVKCHCSRHADYLLSERQLPKVDPDAPIRRPAGTTGLCAEHRGRKPWNFYLYELQYV